MINYSNKITLTRNTRERISESDAGYIRSEIGGATTYMIECEFPIISYNDFLDFQGELLAIDDGISFYNVSIPEKAKMTPFRGDITADTGLQVTVVSAQTYGVYVQLSNCTTTSFVKAGDFIQFVNSGADEHTKVYQIKQDAVADGNGILSFVLNQGAVKDIVATDTIRTGSNVIFKTKLLQSPNYTAIPKNNNENLYSIQNITLTESL